MPAMGVASKPVCLGSEGMRNKRKKVCVCLVSATLFILAATVITLTCCMVKCQAQLEDTTALAGKLTHLQKEKEALEQQQDMAMALVTDLRSELAGTNQTLWEMQEHWDACRTQTHILEKNITALRNTITQLEARDAERETKEQGLQDEIGRLKEELSSRTQQLQDSQEQFEKEREQLQANLHSLKIELQSQRNQGSRGGSLRGHSLSLHLTLLALLLWVLLL